MAIDRIYMDSCCFIESVKSQIGNEEPGRENDLWYLKHLLIAAHKGEVEVVTSYLTIAECRHAKIPNTPNPTDEIKRLFRSILSSGKVVKLAQLTKGTAERARDLHWDDGMNLGGADAIHVATALVTGCKEFLSFDFGKSKSPLKFAPELQALKLRAIEPAKTLLLPGQYLQGDLTANLKP
jgi:predicted nucleic acid-binding protein